MLRPHPAHSARRDFAERFRYFIVSSTLLSSTLPQHAPSTPSLKVPRPPAFDRGLNTASGDIFHEHDIPHDAYEPARPSFDLEPLTFPFLLLVFSVFLTGYYFTAFLMIVFAKWTMHHFGRRNVDQQDQHPLSPSSLSLTIDTLQTLIEAETRWESSICEAMALLEREEYVIVS